MRVCVDSDGKYVFSLCLVCLCSWKVWWLRKIFVSGVLLLFRWVDFRNSCLKVGVVLWVRCLRCFRLVGIVC